MPEEQPTAVSITPLLNKLSNMGVYLQQNQTNSEDASSRNHHESIDNILATPLIDQHTLNRVVYSNQSM